MLNVDLPGVEVRKFCGLPVEEDGEYTIMCVNVAVGELTAEVEGTPVNVPVCQMHLDSIMKEHEVVSLDNTGATLLE